MTGPDPEPGVTVGVGAIDAALEQMLDLPPGDIVVAWVLLPATRNPDGGGDVLRFLSDPRMPPWQIKGILGDALDDVCNEQYNSPPPQED